MSRLDSLQTKLYPIKKLLISIHWPLAITLKLSRGGSDPDGMIGRAITFAHQGPETIMNVIPSINDDITHSLRVGWRNFFSSCCAVVSVFGFWQEIDFGVTYLRI
jgi:hypothetical protein